MAYVNKYKIIMATKSGSISTLYMLEDGYAGELIEYPAKSIQLQYIPRSDDIFEPIYVSQLSIVIDVTDDINNMPNLTTLNDRKYLCELYYDETIEWKGFALSDSVQFSFTTGRKELSFNAIDGLGILENINYPLAEDYVLSDFNDCMFYILNSLNAIAFDTNLNVITGISYYATGMDTRLDSSFADPLKQSYLNFAAFITDDYVVDNCLSVLTKIIKGFGARLFQAEGKWFIVAVSQFAQEEYWYTEYDNAGLVVDSGIRNYNGLIDGFTDNTTGLYFVDNSQMKLLRKGYNKVQFDKKIEYPSNYLTNGDLKQITYYDGNFHAYAWTENENGGLISVTPYPTKLTNDYYIDITNVVSPYDASIKPDYFPYIAFNEVVHISFTSNFVALGDYVPDAFFILKIFIQTPTTFFVINDNKEWVNAGSNFYFEPYNADVILTELSLTLPPAPAAGTIYFEYILAKPDSPYWKSTVRANSVNNFIFTIQPAFQSYQCIGTLSSNDEYVFNVDLDLGYNDSNNGYYSYKGFLADANGLNLRDWFRYGYASDVYRSLSQLVIRQYSNNLNKNVINIDSSFMGMNTENGRFNASMRIKASDTDPAQISVETKQYMIGNSTIDLGNNIIQATLLDINNQNVEADIFEIVSSTSTIPVTPAISHLRSNGYLTSLDAYNGTLTDSVIYTLDGLVDPDYGDVFYEDSTGDITFNGDDLWYKVVTVFPNTKVYRIDALGVVIGIYT
jgi:hypothetical protein